MADLGGDRSAALGEVSEAELRTMKRDHMIRQRQQESDNKRAAENAQKKNELDWLVGSEDEKKRSRQEETMRSSQMKAAARATKRAQEEERNQQRDANIREREASWRVRASQNISKIVEDHINEENGIANRRERARQRKHDRESVTRNKIIEKELNTEELNSRRDQMIEQREEDRNCRETEKVDQLKEEAWIELEAFMADPGPVPLKQVLAGRLKQGLRVTALLAAHRDHREGFEELKDCDLLVRAGMEGKSLFSYVKKIQDAAEKSLVPVPSPLTTDDGRGGASTMKRASTKGLGMG